MNSKNYCSKTVKTTALEQQKLLPNQTNINQLYISISHTQNKESLQYNFINNTDFQKAWNSYLEMRAANGFVITDNIQEILFNQLIAVMGEKPNVESAIAIINKATISGWKDFYPEEVKNHPGNVPKNGTNIFSSEKGNKNNKFHNFEQRDNDFSEIEKKLFSG